MMGTALIEKLKDYLKDKPNYEKFDILYNEMSYGIEEIKNIYPEDLKTFEDLVFKRHGNEFMAMQGAVQSFLKFDNDHWVSVVGGASGLYGDGMKTFEVGYPLNSEDDMDVASWRTIDEVTKIMFKIQIKKPF
jgi:hypothetical protein